MSRQLEIYRRRYEEANKIRVRLQKKVENHNANASRIDSKDFKVH